MPADRAATQAEILLEADLMGHATHGLSLLPNYLRDIESGAVMPSDVPTIMADRGSTVLWDGNRAPGTWLVSRALTEALRRAPEFGVITFVIKRGGHIGALISYLRHATEQGYIMLLMTTNPLARTVVPAGGIDPVLAPNPIAFGSPTEGDPILIDISTSAVANGWVKRWMAEGKQLPGEWLQDSGGNLTRNPAALFTSPPGALLPLGGIELGHKGFALGLIVEILTGGLSGVGHTGNPKDAGNLVFFQLIDPKAFAGLSDFNRDTSLLAASCRNSRPRSTETPVRMPGDKALERRRAQLSSGVELHESITAVLSQWAMKFGVPLPQTADKG